MVNILGDIILIFHIFIVIFVLLAPLLNQTAIYILHISFCICLMVHWMSNQNVCCLTVLEGQIRGIRYDRGFLHRFIGPIYDVPNTVYSQVSYATVIFVMLLSLILLCKSKKTRDILMDIKNISGKKIDFSNKLCEFINCFIKLFQLDI